QFAPAELVGDRTPEVLFRGVAPVERRDVRTTEVVDVADMRAAGRAQLRVSCEQAEADEQVGLASAHRLLEVEDGVRRRSGEPRGALADESLHALRNPGALEEGLAAALGLDERVELLDLVAERD